MEVNSQIIKELNINMSDKFFLEAQTEKKKKEYAESIVNNGVGKEIKYLLKANLKPAKLRKPLKVLLREKILNFTNKFKIVFGYAD